MAINSNVCSHCFTFTLMMTGAFSRNVGKLFSELTDNRLFICVSDFWLYTITVLVSEPDPRTRKEGLVNLHT